MVRGDCAVPVWLQPVVECAEVAMGVPTTAFFFFFASAPVLCSKELTFLLPGAVLASVLPPTLPVMLDDGAFPVSEGPAGRRPQPAPRTCHRKGNGGRKGKLGCDLVFGQSWPATDENVPPGATSRKSLRPWHHHC